MAIRPSGNTSSYLQRTTSLPTVTGFTICGWTKLVGDGAGDVPVFGALPNATIYFNYGSVAGGSMAFGSYNGAAANESLFTSRPAQGTWFHWFVRCSGTGANQLEAGWRAAGDTAYTKVATTLIASPTLTALRLGADNYGSFFDGPYQAVKEHDSALTDDEILNESLVLRPVRFANLRAWAPMIDVTLAVALKDFSGNARDWSNVNTVTLEDGPPVPWGAAVLISQFVSSAHTYFQSCLATTTPAGSLARAVGKKLSASTSPSSLLKRQVAKSALAITTPAVACLRLTGKALVVASTLTGSLRRLIGSGLAASTSPTASSQGAKTTVSPQLASTTPAATARRGISATRLATTMPTGALVKAMQKTLAATTTPTGALATQKVRLLGLLASTSPLALLVRLTSKLASASTSLAASLSRRIGKGLAGATAPTGSLQITKVRLVSLLAQTAPMAVLQRAMRIGLLAVITPAAVASRAISLGLLATGSLIGALQAQKRAIQPLLAVTTPEPTAATKSVRGVMLVAVTAPVAQVSRLIGKALMASGVVNALLAIYNNASWVPNLLLARVIRGRKSDATITGQAADRTVVGRRSDTDIKGQG